MSQVDLSIVVPAYNEAENLPLLLGEVEAAFAASDLKWEIVFVDDGSADPTLDTLRAMRDRQPAVRIVVMDRNSGQSAALEAGFRAARGVLVGMLDADLQNDPADMPRLLDAMRGNGADMAIGVRVNRQDTEWKKIQSRIGNGVRNWITNDRVTDTGCSLKLFRKECVAGLKLYRGMHRFLPTLARLQGFKVVELPVNHRPRRHGTSKYGMMNRAFTGLADCFAVRWMSRRWVRYNARELER